MPQVTTGGLQLHFRSTGMRINAECPNSGSRRNIEPCKACWTVALAHGRSWTSCRVQRQGPRSPTMLPASPGLSFLQRVPFYSFSFPTVFTITRMASTLGQLSKHRAAVGVAAVASTAFALFGYDTTIAGGVIALKRYGSDSWSSVSLTNACAVSKSSLSFQRIRSNLPIYPQTSWPC